MSSKKAPQSGQKRAAPKTPVQSAAAASAKKAKHTPAAPITPKFTAPASDDESDDDAAIFALKAKAAASSGAAEEEDADFEVAAGSDNEEEPSSNAPPSEQDDDDEDEDMRDADESEEEAPPAKKALPTPVKKAAPTPAATPAKPAAPAKPTAAAPTATAKATPAKPAVAQKAVTPAPKKEASSSDSETSESEDESPAPTPVAAAPKPTVPAAKVTPVPAKAAPKPVVKSVLGDSSESSDDEEETPAAAAPRKPQPAKKPTPLQGDASVNPPPKAAKPTKTTPAGGVAGTSSVYDKPLSRPPVAPHTGRNFTVSIALPGSIIGNAQSKELRTYVAGQIARAAATFNVDEIVVFAENGKQTSGGIKGNFEGATRSTDPDVFMARILQYLETPQYLRKLLFPKHADLANAGLLNPLDSPHHVRADEETAYREGVVVKRPVAKGKGENGCWANIGLKNEAYIDRQIEVGTRLTVHIPQVSGSTTRKTVVGRAVAPSTPREKNGTFWGYTTRLAQSLSQVWSECPHKDGYDLCIGTSEHGVDCHSNDFGLPPFKHMIIFFGGLAGLEEHIAADESINVKTPDQLFQLYINSVIGQGCRTIRTEEAVPITLAALYRHVRTNQPLATE